MSTTVRPVTLTATGTINTGRTTIHGMFVTGTGTVAVSFPKGSGTITFTFPVTATNTVYAHFPQDGILCVPVPNLPTSSNVDVTATLTGVTSVVFLITP